MKRVAMTDEPGRWFDEDAAVKFDESTWWNGNNHISTATGSQWNHEALYRTKSGRWVLNSWSQYQGVPETYDEIDDDTAVRWLVRNDRLDAVDDLPDSVLAIVNELTAELEV